MLERVGAGLLGALGFRVEMLFDRVRGASVRVRVFGGSMSLVPRVRVRVVVTRLFVEGARYRLRDTVVPFPLDEAPTVRPVYFPVR